MHMSGFIDGSARRDGKLRRMRVCELYGVARGRETDESKRAETGFGMMERLYREPDCLAPLAPILTAAREKEPRSEAVRACTDNPSRSVDIRCESLFSCFS